MARRSLSIVQRYLLAILCVLLAIGLRLALIPLLGDLFPFATLFFGILVSAWYGGFGPAVAATLLGGILASRYLLRPFDSLAVAQVEHQAGLVLYILVGFGIATLGGVMRTALDRAEAAAARAALQREELRTTLASIGDAVLVTDLDGRVVSLNPVAENLTGWPSAEAVGRSLAEVFVIVNEETRRTADNPVGRVLKDGTVVGLANHTILMARDGKEYPIDDSAAPIRDAAGQLVGVVLVFRDVSERRDAEAAQAEQKEQLRLFVEHAPAAVAMLDREMRYVLCSRRWLTDYGLGDQDLHGRSHYDVFPDLPQRWREAYRRCLNGAVERSEEDSFTRPDGQTEWLRWEIRPWRNNQGEIGGLLVFSEIITEWKQAQQAVRQQADILDGILGASVDHIYVVDRQGRYQHVSKGGARVLGFEPPALIGKHWRELGLPAAIMERFDLQRDQVLQSSQASVQETVFQNPQGVDQHFEYAVAPIKRENGHSDAVVVVSRDVTERKKVEHNLKLQARVLESMAEGVSLTDEAGIILYTNPAEDRMFGYRAGELIGQHVTVLNAYPADENRRIVNDVIEQLRTCGLWTGEWQNRKKDGIPFTTFARITALEANGQRYWVCVQEDVTERKRAAAALRQIEALLDAVINHAPACIFAKDREGRYLLANRSLAALVGREQSEFRGRTDHDFFPPDVAQQFWEDDAAIINSGQPRTYEESFPQDGVTRTYLTVKFPLRDEQGEVYAACAVATDITALKHTQARLQATADRFTLALNAAQLGDWSWDAATDVVTMSERAAAIFGIPAGPSMTWTTLQGRLHEADRDRARLQVEQAVAGQTQYDIEYRVLRPNGTQIWVAALGRAHYAPDGTPLGMFGVVKDITARKEAEEALREEARTTETLYRIGTALAAQRELHQIVQTVTDESTALAGAQFGAFFYNVLNEHCESYTLYTISGVPRAAFENFPMPRNTAIFEPTFRGQGVVRLDDVTRDPRYGKSAPFHGMPAGHLPVRSYLAVPVVSRSGEVLGGMFFGHSAVGVFEERHERLVASIAAQAAVAIDNARLYRQVQESEARLAAIVNHSPAVIFLKDRHGRYLLTNRRFEEIARAGGIEGPYLGRSDADLLPPALAARFRADDLEVMESRQVKIYEETEEFGGAIRTGLTTKFPLFNETGEVYAVCGINLDITDRVKAETALKQSEERLRLALEAGRMGVWDWHLHTNEIKWSDNLEPVHGLPPGTFGGTFAAFQELIHPEDRPFVNQTITRTLEERSSYDIEFRNLWPDGSVHWMAGKGKVFLGEDGEPVRMIGIGMDVTERKRAEQDTRFLADASATLAALVDYGSTLQKVARLAVPTFADWCSVDMLDESGGLHRVAVAHADPSKVELAHELHRRFPPDPAAPQGVWNILRTGRSELVPEISDDLLAASVADADLLQIIRALGLRSYMGVPLSVRGKVLGVVTFIAAESGRRYDATNLASAEDLAHRAAVAIENARLYQEVREADRKKDEFLAILGHELRNPLAPISNALHILKLPRANGQLLEQAREMMERQVQHMVRLVDDLLDVSRIVRGKVELRREPIDLAAVVARAVETAQPLIDAEGHELTVTLPPEPLLVSGDLVRLAQVVGNLLNNSARYTDRGGKIEIEGRRAGDRAMLIVRDTGIGIAPEILPRIWDLFVQADRRMKHAQGGMGIGLALVKGLVELHGGTVEARSGGKGKGSEFVVNLPLVTHGQVEGTPRPEEDPAARGVSQRVLIVDDNIDAAESLAMILRLSGHQAQVAHDGTTALKLAETDPPAVAFLDIGMPGMDGYELARRFKVNPALQNVYLVALTGWGQEEDRRRTREAGFDAHEVKPVSFEALQKLMTSR